MIENTVERIGKTVFPVLSERASALMANVSEPHARFFAAALCLHAYLSYEVFTVPNLNASCSKFLHQKSPLCFPFVNERFFAFVPDVLVLGFVAYVSYAAKDKLVEKYGEKFPARNFHYLLFPYLALRAASLVPHGNFLDRFHNHFDTVGKVAAFAIPLAYAAMLSSSANSPRGVPVHLETSGKPWKKDDPRAKFRETAVRNVKQVFPWILQDIAYNNFSQISVSKDGVRIPNAMAIRSVEFLNDKELFVELNLIPPFIADIGRLKSFDWKTGIEARGKIDRLVSAGWMSSGGRNGVVLALEEETIDFSKTYSYPSLLSPNPALRNPLEFVVGVDERGEVVVFDLAKLPHLLVAGTTGGGKSVAITDILVSLMKNRIAGHEIEFHIVDPKRVEFWSFKGLPGFSVITNLDSANNLLKLLVVEMENRYKTFEKLGKKNIGEYRAGGGKMSHIVVIIDEFADIMTTDKERAREFENCVIRISQLARAAGIHLVIATQNPIQEVITSNIKANIVSRIGCRTSDGIKSTTIIDDQFLKDIKQLGEVWLKADGWRLHHLKTFFINSEEFQSFIEYYDRECGKTGGVPVHLLENETENRTGPNPYAALNEFDSYAREKGLPYEKYSGAYAIFRHVVTNKGYKGRNELRGIVSDTAVTQAQIDDLIPALRDGGLVEYLPADKRNRLTHEGELPGMDFLEKLYETIRSVISEK